MKMTPQELLFQSFRHSQGNIGPQLRIFRNMDLVHGVKADLHPTARDFERYVKYARGTEQSKGHIDLRENEDQVAGGVVKTMKDIRKYDQASFGTKVRRKGREAAVDGLAWGIMQVEMRILGTDKPWPSYRSRGECDRALRFEARVERGQSSFLYYYGRDGHSTGRPEFDELYGEVWQQAEQPYYDNVRAVHARVVVDAELQVLGKTLLGRMVDVPTRKDDV